jgi:pimeloyl-ACP methyl ester carboxylesterase
VSRLTENRTRQDGRRVRFLTGGAGPILVLCHGFLGSAENFDAWIETLCSRRTLVIPDLPGCGESDPLPAEHTAAGLAASVAALVDELGIERFDLGGLCLGAPVACALARRRPSAVRRLLLHTPLLAPRLVRRRFHLMTRAMTAPGVFPAVVRLSRMRRISDIYKRLMVEGADVDPVAAGVNFDNQQRADPRAAREWLHDGLRCHDADLIGGLAVPVLFIAAAADRIVDVERLRRMCAAWPLVRCTVDDDAGHAWSPDSVARQLAAITAFLDDDAPGATTSAA